MGMKENHEAENRGKIRFNPGAILCGTKIS